MEYKAIIMLGIISFFILALFVAHGFERYNEDKDRFANMVAAGWLITKWILGLSFVGIGIIYIIANPITISPFAGITCILLYLYYRSEEKHKEVIDELRNNNNKIDIQ